MTTYVVFFFIFFYFELELELYLSCVTGTIGLGKVLLKHYVKTHQRTPTNTYRLHTVRVSEGRSVPGGGRIRLIPHSLRAIFLALGHEHRQSVRGPLRTRWGDNQPTKHRAR